MDLKDELVAEIEKWTAKIRDERSHVSAPTNKEKGFLKNVDAYIADSRYFVEKQDHVRGFEALIWAWAYLTIGVDEGWLIKSE